MRKTSDVKDAEFPFADDQVAFVLVYNLLDGQRAAVDENGVERGFDHGSTRERKVRLVERAIHLGKTFYEVQAQPVAILLAVWPGKNRSDVFLVDDLDEALAAFG